MKKITTLVAIVFALTTITTQVSAQKIAHLRIDSLITLMPEAKKAEAIAQDFAKQYEKEMVSMNSEFQAKYSDYMTNKDIWIESIRQTKEADLQNMQQRMAAFKENFDSEYQAKYAELSKPLNDKMKKAIEAVAKENGYKYVLDTSSGVVLYSEASDDILMLVKKKLDSMPEAALPGAAPKETTPKTNTTTPKTNTTTPKTTGGK